MTKWKIYVSSGMVLEIEYVGGELRMLEDAGLFEIIEIISLTPDVTVYRVELNGEIETAVVVPMKKEKHPYAGEKGDIQR